MLMANSEKLGGGGLAQGPQTLVPPALQGLQGRLLGHCE